MVEYVHQQGFPTPRLVPTVDGQMSVFCSLHKNRDEGTYEIVRADADVTKFAVRLLEYMPGSLLAEVPLTPALCFQEGLCAAHLDNILQTFEKSNHSDLSTNWSMENLPHMRDLLYVIDDVNTKRVCSDVIEAFETEVLKNKDRKTFLRGMIHNDFNCYNILVGRSFSSALSSSSWKTMTAKPPSVSSSFPATSSASPSSTVASSSSSPSSAAKTMSVSYSSPMTNSVFSASTTSSSSSPPSSPASSNSSAQEEWFVEAVLDFGDACETYLLLEVAIAMSYVMMQCPDDCDAEELAGHTLAGYLSKVRLSRTEVQLLPLAICARFAQSIVGALHKVSLDSCNQDYVMVSVKPSLRHLFNSWCRPRDVILHKWRYVSKRWNVEFPE